MTADLDFGYVPPGHLNEYWPQASDLLRPILDKTGVSLDETLIDLRRQQAQLWVAMGDTMKLALLTQAGDGNVHLWCLGGREPKTWLHFIEVIKLAARHDGFQKLTIKSRRAWKRIFPDWEQVGDELEYDLWG